MKRLTGELAGLSWIEVQRRAERDPFVHEISTHALANASPEALVPKLGFMASRSPVGALLRQLRSIERRRRLIGWTIAISLAAAAVYALILIATRS